MATYLIKTTEMYRCNSEQEANNLVKAAKAAHEYEVIKSTIESKQAKAKGEITDEWKRVTITKVFSDEKEPFGNLMPIYKEEEEEEE